MKILLTGTAGFIGFHLTSLILEEGHSVIGIDSIDPYYDINLKYARLSEHGIEARNRKIREVVHSKFYPNYSFYIADLADHDFILSLMKKENFEIVINLAAQAGIRYSITNPQIYIHSNINGFLSILEGCRYTNVKHLIYASTSSVYGLSTEMPFNENHNSDHPMSIYAATKKSNEIMAHTYSHLFSLPTTGLRFFTVYGPWGRPDMALSLFTDSILNKRSVKIFNNGEMIRDFTFVKDIVESIYRIAFIPAKSDPCWDSSNPTISTSSAPYRIYNIGNNRPIFITEYINAIEEALNIKAIREYLPLQPGDLIATHADVSRLENEIHFRPSTDVKFGIQEFVKWYKSFYKYN